MQYQAKQAQDVALTGFRSIPRPMPAAAANESENELRLIGDIRLNRACNAPPIHRASKLVIGELETANRRKDELLAVVSHELRGPIAAIQNAIRALGKPAIDAGGRQKMQELIERQVGRLTLIVADLSDLARVTSAHLYLSTETIDLRIVLRHAIETVEFEIARRGHHLNISIPDLPVWVAAETGRMEQVFINLLTNASKYTPLGGELSVCLHTETDHAVVRIRDSGIGIAPDMLPEIFELFRQADEALPYANAGLGIGLAVVRNLVELHGGSVSAASAGPGLGSEFVVQLPRGGLVEEIVAVPADYLEMPSVCESCA